jgi:arylsulfatase A-like enzyme
LVVLLIDALGQADLARAEEAEDVAPRLLRFGYQSVRFLAAQAPAPESAASVWSVLTGNGPLRHGVLGSHAPAPAQTVAEVLRANGYATAAFTQGDSLTYGGGLEQGFQLFDDGYAPPEPPRDSEAGDENDESAAFIATGAATTLERAWDWIDAHQAVKFLAVVRLRDLAPAMNDEDAYRAALRGVDEQAGWFLRRLRDQETRRNTLIVLAGTHGTRIGEHDAFAELPVTEASVHVPLYVYARWLERQERTDPVSLVDLGPTLLERAQARFTRYVDGEDILPGPLGAKPISAGGDPLVLSLRTEDRRLFWLTGLTPFAGPPTGGMPEPAEDAVLFFDLDPRRRSPRNLATRLPVQVRIGVDILQRALEDHFERWPGPGHAND